MISTILTIQAASAVTGGRVIGNRMWNDTNRNGRQDRGEPSMPGVRVWLHDTSTRPWRKVGVQQTNRDGRYGFKNLRPGCYAVMVQIPAGMALTRPRIGNDQWNSDFDTSRVARRCIKGNDWQIDGGFVPGGGTPSTTTTTTAAVRTPTGDHSGCRLEFGSDGYLWVTTCNAHLATTAQNPQSLGGKILRITTSGAGAPGDPGGQFRPEVYNYGQRNVQGIERQPSTGRWYSVEHGHYCDDEINTVVAGGNYGWSPQNAAGAYDDNQQMTDLARFPNAISAVWTSGCPTIAPSGGEFIDHASWGW